MPNKFDTLNIIPKPKLLMPFWVKPLMWASGITLLIVLVLFGFYYFQASSWKSKVEAKEGDYLALNTPENKAIEERVGKISQKLEKFSQAFLGHKFSYTFFEFLRGICHPNVSFSDMSLNLSTGSANLTGQTNSYRSLSEQILILKNIKEISSLDVSDINLNKEGMVAFRLSFLVDPIFFNNQK